MSGKESSDYVTLQRVETDGERDRRLRRERSDRAYRAKHWKDRYNDYRILHPVDILNTALYRKEITEEEYEGAIDGSNKALIDSAIDAVSWVNDSWPEGHGFGSSDRNPVVKDMLSTYKTLRRRQSSVRNELVKMGSTSPELRPHLRPIISHLEKSSSWATAAKAEKLSRELAKLARDYDFTFSEKFATGHSIFFLEARDPDVLELVSNAPAFDGLKMKWIAPNKLRAVV